EGIGSGPLGCLGNVIWLGLAGWRLALGPLIPPPGPRLTHSGTPVPAARPPGLGDPHVRAAVRVGASQARRACALAHRQGHREYLRQGTARHLPRDLTPAGRPASRPHPAAPPTARAAPPRATRPRPARR